MSSYSAIPIATKASSESRILVDACLAHIREDAGLDDDPVLPPLHVLLGKPPPRIHVSESARVPCAEAIVRDATKTGARRASSSAHPATRDRVRRRYWPVLLCGFVGGAFGGLAVMKSPIGQRPDVQQAVGQAKIAATDVYVTVVAAKSRLVNR